MGQSLDELGTTDPSAPAVTDPDRAVADVAGPRLHPFEATAAGAVVEPGWAEAG